MLAIIYSFFESIGRARTANVLATYGYHELAKDVMTKEEPIFEVHP